MTVIERFGSDEDGVALARPVAWPGPDSAPILRLVETGVSESLAIGQRAAARLIPLETGDIEARIIRRLEPAGERIVGVFQNTREGGRLVPVDRRNRTEYRVAERDAGGADDGELVDRRAAFCREARERREPASSNGSDAPSDPGAISLLAIATS